MTQEDEIIHVKSWMDLGDCNYEIDHNFYFSDYKMHYEHTILHPL